MEKMVPLLLLLLASLVLLLLTLSELVSTGKGLDLLVFQLTEGLDEGGNLGNDLTLSNGVSGAFGGLDQVTGNFLDEFSSTGLDLRAGNRGDEEWAQGSFFHGGHAELSLNLS